MTTPIMISLLILAALLQARAAPMNRAAKHDTGNAVVVILALFPLACLGAYLSAPLAYWFGLVRDEGRLLRVIDQCQTYGLFATFATLGAAVGSYLRSRSLYRNLSMNGLVRALDILGDAPAATRPDPLSLFSLLAIVPIAPAVFFLALLRLETDEAERRLRLDLQYLRDVPC